MNPKYLIAAFGALTAALAACGTTNNITQSKCGAGTRLQGDTCVSDLPDSGIAADTGTAAEDAGGLADTGVEPNLPDEPCPVEDADTAVFNCDPKCGPMTDEKKCRVSSCRGKQEPVVPPLITEEDVQNYGVGMDLTAEKKKWVLRLPRDPWKIFNLCDQNRAQPADSAPKYPVRIPQPRYYFIMFPRFLAAAQPPFVTSFTIDAKSYNATLFENELRTNSCSNVYYNTAFPLMDRRSSEKSQCFQHPQGEPYPTISLCANPGSNGPPRWVAILTDAVNQPAANIIFYTTRNVRCEVQL